MLFGLSFMQNAKRTLLTFLILIAVSNTLWAETEEPFDELVIIDGKSFSVPPPWRGHKISTPTLTAPPLVQIPLDLSENNSKLFILEDTCIALIKMAESAEKDGILLQVDSSYRSSWYQKKIFVRLMKEGREFDDIVRYVAPPGYSEHMLGTVVDFTPSDWRFAKTLTYAWLKEYANSFGFFETLPEYSTTGKPWEPWHWRFQGNSKTARTVTETDDNL